MIVFVVAKWIMLLVAMGLFCSRVLFSPGAVFPLFHFVLSILCSIGWVSCIPCDPDVGFYQYHERNGTKKESKNL